MKHPDEQSPEGSRTVDSDIVTILVDEIRKWPTRIRCFKQGSAHLTCDPCDTPEHVERLHAFAAKIGLKREWYQDGTVAHYDLTPKKRAAALLAGAKFVPAREQARKRLGIESRKDPRP